MNNGKSKTRIIALAFLVCIITVSVFSNMFILSHTKHEHNHNGVGGGCVTCERLSNAMDVRKQLSMVSAVAVLVIAKMFFDVKVLKMTTVCVLPITPVGLKTRMNN